MKGRLFTKKEWDKALRELSKSQKIFVPAKEKDFHNFTVLDNNMEPDFDFQNTRLSPKSIVFPQSERMFEYTLDETSPDAHILKEAPKDFPPQAVVGIRPCDAHAFQIVNVNFDNPEYKDPWWVRRYRATTFVGLGCNEPCSTCFCTSVGGGPFSEKGLDILLHDLGDRFLAKAITEKGIEFLDKIGSGKEASEQTLKKAALEAEAALGKISSSVPTDRLKEKTEIELFDAPFWEKIAFPCINCGTCTYLCPTCWCFDIQDEVFRKEGDRIRNWDSCMFPLFTLHGSGHNPREKKVQRVRQRFMHKLKYYVDKYGNGVACVGCGRCVQFCPVNIDIREVFELMNGY
ncbi:MAG: 4Fe-4S dicluster domain-containing protein [Deltaproteobacteria bacterium]|nr:4Fe-4S dicluster domain-containing protein [Deltaproteobacteria bacterium]MBW1936524.1 4Fe-4S dicluster domain-containing protein [Deltaproteobacteria bacterium]MBW1978323.1 4Fe-4S dicluster domain-containing protein [Deltaproteobacteria bacterium]MBW2044617.1 4Fe-4S dicluster domain-containing protein [Deltaproteobacteria bacterium]MBW2300672.1 4Fe-4S dicluster domain-containing protein [Deltaproteobacteria bacterium]